MKLRHMRFSVVALLGAAILASACSSRERHHDPYASIDPGYVYRTEPAAPHAVPPPPPPPPQATHAPVAGGQSFENPTAAMHAVAEVCGFHDEARLERIFGPGATEILWSGDEVADTEAAKRVKALIEEGVVVEEVDEGRVTMACGHDRWPFPVPLVRLDGGWKFDLEGGKEELFNRRIGKNELRTIATMYAYVDAQREYASKGRDGNKPAFAQRVRSTAGRQDGLYWETGPGEEPSPLGPLVSEAHAQGYGPTEEGKPAPFEGYYYRILTGQGANAPGGARSYLDANGLMTGGFAGIAWPATYGNSGVMTFLVSQCGVVFQKDLGENTEQIASTMTVYDVDRTWHPTRQVLAADDDDG